MTNFTELSPVSSDPPAPVADQLRLAVAAYLTRFKGSSRDHSESDLRCFLAWSAERGLDPMDARRPHLELYIRWMGIHSPAIRGAAHRSPRIIEPV